MKRGVNMGARWAAALAGVLLAGAAMGAGALQRLPPDRPLAQGEGSPGAVVFSHGSHVDPSAPGCVACHPRPFPMLGAGKKASGAPMSHQAMEAGAGCGACHGKDAFGFDSCELCHK